MISTVKNNLSYLWNSRNDWSSKEKLIVIESDDWGGIKMPSRENFENLIDAGIRVDNCLISKFGGLETPADFSALEQTFDRISKKTGKNPVITANYNLANPDFDQIKSGNYEKYERKYFWDDLIEKGKLADYQKSLKTVSDKAYFFPQLHGMEHLNVPYWMEFVQKKSEETMKAFENGVYSLSTDISSENRRSFAAAYNYSDENSFFEYIEPSIKEAAKKFEEFFGFKSLSFIAPNYVWSELIEKVLSETGVKYLQGGRSQLLPIYYNKPSVKRSLGELNKFGQKYLVRNCYFEPSTVKDKKTHTQRCLNQVEMAFRYRKPAVICSHRLNFVGSFYNENRDENLKLLEELLLEIIKKWPEVKFINSVDLGKRI